MIKNKNILLTAVMRRLIYIVMPNASHKQHTIGPNIAEAINEIAAFYLTKKRGYYYQWEYQ
jgi:hypothetical protein